MLSAQKTNAASSADSTKYLFTSLSANVPTDDPVIATFEILDSTPSKPSKMPSATKSITDIEFLDREAESKQVRKSAHQTYTVKLKNSEDPNEFYFYKAIESTNPIAELEALNGGIAQYLAPNYVPETFAVHDGERMVAVISKAIPDFKSNKDDPLKKEDCIVRIKDLVIEANPEINQHRTQLNKSLATLSSLLARCSNAPTPTSSYLGMYKACANLYNYYVSSAPTAVKCQSEISAFSKLTNPSANDFSKLFVSLKERREHIKDRDDSTNEADTLEEAIASAEFLHSHPSKMILNNTALNALEEADRSMQKQHFAIRPFNKSWSFEVEMDGEKFPYSVLDLKNFRTLKAVATIRWLKTAEKEGDDHNRNSGKTGTFDFDHTNEHILYNFTKHTIIEQLSSLRKPTDTTFKFTARDYCIHPDSRDATPFYSPTKQNMFSKSLVDTVSIFYDISKNLYTVEDNDTFKQLANNEIYVYYKNVAALKYILTNIRIYECIHALHLRKNWLYSGSISDLKAELVPENVDLDTDERESLLSLMGSQKMERISEIRDVLVKMPEFKDFLIHHGENALNQILNEVERYRENLEKQLPTKPHFQNLIDAIRPDDFKETYKAIYDETMELEFSDFEIVKNVENDSENANKRSPQNG